MTSMRSREGWLYIDNRLGAPLSATHEAELAQLRQTGVHIAGAAPGTVFESATITCSHCHVIVVLNPLRTRERGYCGRCHHYVCDAPGCNDVCRPMGQLIDHLQEAAATTAGSTPILS